MGAPLEDLYKIGIKLFAADGAAVRPHELVPIFHRWIQSRALPEQMLVDVADYEHVPDGPGVLLVAHEGNLTLDLGGGRLGLTYTRKQPAPGTLNDRWRAVARTVLTAAQLLEDDPSLAGRLRFRTDELKLFANDRLLAPNDPATLTALRPAFDTLTGALYGDARCEVVPEKDPRNRLGVSVTTAGAPPVAQLLARL